jgi:hypothetical protein
MMCDTAISWFHERLRTSRCPSTAPLTCCRQTWGAWCSSAARSTRWDWRRRAEHGQAGRLRARHQQHRARPARLPRADPGARASRRTRGSAHGGPRPRTGAVGRRHLRDGMAGPRAPWPIAGASIVVTACRGCGSSSIRSGSARKPRVARASGPGRPLECAGAGPCRVARSGYARAATCSLATVRRTASRASGGSRTAASPASLSTSRTSQSSPA